MAVRGSCCHHPSSSMAMVSRRFGTRKAADFRFSTSAHGGSSSQPSVAATATERKVFEDQLRGIVCYRDEKGEMTCEGYDEGPRIGMRLPEKACFPWPVGVQVTDFIQLATLRVFQDASDVPHIKGDQERHLTSG